MHERAEHHAADTGDEAEVGRHRHRVLGLGLGVWLIIRLRSTERMEPPDLREMAKQERPMVVVARLAGSVVGALVAGLMTVGLGGRLMMRILAATSPPQAQGRLTDADAIVGEITTGGTVSFVLFVGLFGGLVGLALFARLACIPVAF